MLTKRIAINDPFLSSSIDERQEDSRDECEGSRRRHIESAARRRHAGTRTAGYPPAALDAQEKPSMAAFSVSLGRMAANVFLSSKW